MFQHKLPFNCDSCPRDCRFSSSCTRPFGLQDLLQAHRRAGGRLRGGAGAGPGAAYRCARRGGRVAGVRLKRRMERTPMAVECTYLVVIRNRGHVIHFDELRGVRVPFQFSQILWKFIISDMRWPP